MAGDLGVRKRVLMLLHQKGHALADVRGLLLEYRANLGDDGALGAGLGLRAGGGVRRVNEQYLQALVRLLLGMGQGPTWLNLRLCTDGFGRLAACASSHMAALVPPAPWRCAQATARPRRS